MRDCLERLYRRPAAVLALALTGGFGVAWFGFGIGMGLLLEGVGLGLWGVRVGGGARGDSGLGWVWAPEPAGAAGRSRVLGGKLLAGTGLALIFGALRLQSLPSGHVLERVAAGQEIEARVSGRLGAVSLRPEAGPRVELQLEGIDGQAANGRILLRFKRSEAVLLQGDWIETRARLWRVRPALLPGGWDREESLRSQDIHVEGTAESPARVQPGPAIWRWLPKLSDRIAAGLAAAPVPEWALQARWKDQHGPFLNAILLGRREGLTPDLAEQFRKSGLYHLFAISGMNLALIAGALYGVLGRTLGRKAGAAASAAAIVVYSALTVGQASVWRASLMVLIHLGGVLLGRRPDGINSVCLAAAILLCLQPALVADLGLQLTVLATVAVILFARPAARQIRGPRFLALTLGASVAAQAVVTPLLLAHFRELGVYGLLSGLAAGPPFAVALGLAMLAATLIALGIPADAAICQWILSGASACSAFLFELARVFAAIPGSVLLVPRLPAPAVYLCLALAASFLFRRNLRRIQAQVVLVLLLAGAVLWGLLPEARAPVRITFLGIGNADCALLELPGSRSVLVDGAGDPRGRFDIGNFAVVPFLWHSGIEHLETAYLSHAHPDHALGLFAVLGGLKVDRLRLAGPLPPEGLVRDLWKASQARGTDFELVNPYLDPRYPLDENDRSLVLQLRYQRFSALFAGDVEAAAEHDLADTYPRAVASTVLKVGHHGSCTSSHEAFLNAVRPRLAIVSVGFHNTFGHPCAEAVQRLEHTVGRGRVLYTSEGSVRVASDGTDLQVEQYTAKGWQELWSESLPKEGT